MVLIATRNERGLDYIFSNSKLFSELDNIISENRNIAKLANKTHIDYFTKSIKIFYQIFGKMIIHFLDSSLEILKNAEKTKNEKMALDSYFKYLSSITSNDFLIESSLAKISIEKIFNLSVYLEFILGVELQNMITYYLSSIENILKN